MDLLEHRGKDLFRRHMIPVPDAELYTGGSLELPGSDRVVVKAQVPAGKREEHGGIRIVDREQAAQTADSMLGSTISGETVQAVLLEEPVDIADELYISLSIDRAGKQYRLVFSGEGGSGIEERSDAATSVSFHGFDREQVRDAIDHEHADTIVDIAARMYDLLRQEDALLVEINPLVVTTGGDLVAVDSKVRIDDNALYRHEFKQESGGDTLEDQAAEKGLEFVDLDGNIGVIGNGAGLVMATLDSINHFGGSPANFLDIGGGADVETMQAAMSVALEQDIDGLFINVFGGITRCDQVAEGIISFVEDEDPDVPLVIRLVGTNQEQGKQMLQDAGIHALDSMDDCADKIVELAEGNDADR